MKLKVITILCVSLAMLVALNVVLAQEEETTELRIENPNPSPAPSIGSCDQFGNDKNTFYPDEDVYAKGNGYPASTVVVIYIIPDGHDATPDNAKTITSTTTDTEGTLTVTRVWRAPLDLGKYDIWVDVNINGVYDEGDVWNYPALNVYLFLVTPEVPFGTIASMLTTVGAFAFFALFRKVK